MQEEQTDPVETFCSTRTNHLADPEQERSPRHSSTAPTNGLLRRIRLQKAEVFTSTTKEHFGLSRQANVRMKQLMSTSADGLPSFA